MSKKLALLLDQPERAVVKSLQKLEFLNGYPSHDARFLADHHQASRQKIASLGLDPDDTTGEELYQALRAKYHSDSALIDKAMGINKSSGADKRMAQAVKLIEGIVTTDEMWVLKQAVAKRLLRDNPPKKLMKLLNYRSPESFLKHGCVAEIYSALPYTESAAWQRSFNKAVARLQTTDYELRAPEVVAMSGRWSAVDSGRNLTSVNSLVGAVALWPTKSVSTAPVLTLALLLLDGLETLADSKSAGSIAGINPALLWWEQAKHLVTACGDETVSMNYQDVAKDHLAQARYAKRRAEGARHHLWNELVSRYENQEERLGAAVAELEDKTADELEKLAPRKTTGNLAAEYAEAIANEF